ncbi:AAA family ATPase [Romboutsia hominis]|uniref:AAA family ATPase n=1 Tax=Romboutsia hominis TaxID=1507512 RepID=UPI000B80A6EE|nr:AAA family ATPase [Romboutsia hominis]
MFTYIKFKNYKSLLDVDIDLTLKKKPIDMAIIYGENGSGKSNIASGFYTLIEFCDTLSINQMINSVLEDLDGIEKADFEESKRFFLDMLRKRHRDVDTIIKSVKTIDSIENMSIEYGFDLDGKKGSYYIETNNESIVREKLEFVIESKKGCYFDINNKEVKLNPRVFIEKTYLEELLGKVNKFWGKHTLLSIIKNDMESKVKGYVKGKISNNFSDILYFLMNFSCTFKDGIRAERGAICAKREILTKLDYGNIDLNEEVELIKAEDFLNDVFTGLYSDIKNVYYKKEIKGNKIKYNLVFRKRIGDKIVDIDFDRESTGTMRILDILPSIYTAINGGISIIDEFDSGIHDIMVRDIIREVKKNIDGQLILTTHNTLLLEEKNLKDSIYFIAIDSYGDKDVFNINDYENRTHPNHNSRDLYLKGLYDAIPSTGNFDLAEIKKKFN